MKIKKQRADKCKINGTPGSVENIEILNKNLDANDVPVTEATNRLTAQETTELKNLVSSSRDPQVIASYLAAKSQQESLTEDKDVYCSISADSQRGEHEYWTLYSKQQAYECVKDMLERGFESQEIHVHPYEKVDVEAIEQELSIKSKNKTIEKLHGIPVITEFKFINKQPSKHIGIYDIPGFVTALNSIGKNQFMIRSDNCDTSISVKDLLLARNSLIRYNWTFEGKVIPEDAGLYFIFKKINADKNIKEKLDMNIPVIDRLNFINKRSNRMPGIQNINDFIDCLNAIGKDKFMVKETRAGSNLSLADLKDERTTLKKKGWKWYTRAIPGEFLTYYVFEKINKGENMKENLEEDKPSYTLFDIDKLLCVTSAQYLGAKIPPARRNCINEINIPHNMRFKNFNTIVKDYDDTIVLIWITQEPFNSSDFEIFIKEVRSAFNQIIEDIHYKKPFKIVVNVKCRDGNCKKTELLNFNKNSINENLVEDDLYQLKAEIEDKVKKYMISQGFEPDEVKDYSVVDIYFDSKERDTAIVEVRAELSYDGLFELGLKLNKVIADYDEDAYFEPVEPGITSAYIHNITPEKINECSNQVKEGLDIKEIYENNPNYINDLYEILIQAQVTIDKIRENYSSDVYDIIKLGIEQNLDEFMAHDDDGWTMYAAIKEAHKSPEDDDEDDDLYDDVDENLQEAMSGYVRTDCAYCGKENRVKVDFPDSNKGFTTIYYNCKDCGKKNKLVDEYNGVRK